MQTKAMLDLGVRQDQLTVLLIDDDLVSREVTATVLTMNGFNVHTADGGNAAVDSIAEKEVAPDVILMDAQMPGLHGTALIAALRSRSRARIIAVSGSTPPAEVSAAADGSLLKPLEIAALRQILEGRSALLEAAASAPSDGDAPVVNAEVLARLRHLMPESSVREIYRAIVTDLSRRAQLLEIAMAKGDVAEVRRIGHAVKGGCAMAGAMQAARVGAELEACSFEPAGNQSDNSTRLLNDLRSAAQNLERILKGELPA
jgi:CheY-like chemotaxis protein/HPt (histidine-containing phosphotransfer) domain-containing protein